MPESNFMPLNNQEIVFSLIMATYKRSTEVELFILSLINQMFDTSKIELIIVDQNKDKSLDKIINKYKKSINIEHIHSDIVGLSFNRNIGIKLARGNIIAFPDDDCTFYEDTLYEVYNAFANDDKLTTVLGQIFDRKKNIKIIRKWPDNIKKINEINFFYLYSCITIFTKNKSCMFDTNLGLSTKFGSYEDADYIFSLVKENSNGIYYFPTIQVNHPQLNINTMDSNKILNYGLGFGAFCKKNLSWIILILYCGTIAYHTAKLLFAIIKFDFSEIKKRYFSIISRLRGFYYFNA